MHRLFINLTNGIDFLDNKVKFNKCSFIRIPSAWCEQKLFYKILETLPPEFYLALALTGDVFVVDYSHEDKPSRALWQGCSWITYAINKRWFNEEVKDYQLDRASKCLPYFQELYNKMPGSTKSVLDYYKKFLNVKEKVTIMTIYDKTDHDGDYEYFTNKLREAYYERLYDAG